MPHLASYETEPRRSASQSILQLGQWEVVAEVRANPQQREMRRAAIRIGIYPMRQDSLGWRILNIKARNLEPSCIERNSALRRSLDNRIRTIS